MAKTIKKAPSALEVAKELAEELSTEFSIKKNHEARIKELKLMILESVKTDPEAFFKNGAKSCKIAGIEIIKKPNNVYEFGSAFNLAEFYKAYPNAVKAEIVHSKMTNIDLAQWDLTLKSTEEITISPLKVA